jgi:hypothetical protein
MKRLWMRLWDTRGFWPGPILWTTIPAITGIVCGHLSAAGASLSPRAIRDILAQYAARGEYPSEGFWIGAGLAVTAALLIAVSGKTAAGLLFIPAVVLAHGFLLSFTVSSVLMASGPDLPVWEALWKAGAVFLPMLLLEWPALILMSVQSSAGAQSRLLRGYDPDTGWEPAVRAVLCCASLCLAALVRVWPMPRLLSTFFL